MENLNLTIQDIKKEFLIYKNGIVADSLRKIYPPGKVIFGLTVPQFLEIARKYPKDKELALSLWKDNTSREARLFSLYILPPSQLKEDEVIEMINGVESSEQAEFLAFKILRNLPFARELYEQICKKEYSNPNVNYCIVMFGKNLQN